MVKVSTYVLTSVFTLPSRVRNEGNEVDIATTRKSPWHARCVCEQQSRELFKDQVLEELSTLTLRAPT